MAVNRELFRAYLDESESSSGVYVVGGFVGKGDVWDKMEPQCLKCLPSGISFHATDCFTGNREFKNMSIGDRTTLLERLTDVITAHEVRLIGYGIDATTYKKLAPKAKENEFLRNKYAAPFGGVVQLACEAMGNTPKPDDIWKILERGEQWEQCGFYIESNEYSPSANRTIAEMRIDKELWFRSRIGTDTYGTKTGHAGISLLQIADLGAFLAAKHISRATESKISWKKFYEKLQKSGRIYRTVQADKRSLNLLHETHAQLKREKAEGRNYWDDI
jgi:hypothetical protein